MEESKKDVMKQMMQIIYQIEDKWGVYANYTILNSRY